MPCVLVAYSSKIKACVELILSHFTVHFEFSNAYFNPRCIISSF